VVDTIREIRAEKPDTQPAQIPVADAAAALEAVGTETQKRTRQRRKLVRELGNEPDPAPAPTTEPAADNSPEIRPEKSTTPEPEPQPVPDEGKQDAPYITCQRCEERIYAPFTRPCTDPLCQHSSTPAPKPPSPSDLGALL
jgi:hypothetical protein